MTDPAASVYLYAILRAKSVRGFKAFQNVTRCRLKALKMQQIFIEGLSVPTLIGVYDWERTQQTTLIMDLLINADLSEAMASDDVNHTIDYAAVAECVKEVGASSSFELLEALSKAIVDSLCTRFPIQKLVLKIEKPGILPDAQRVGIQVTHEVSE